MQYLGIVTLSPLSPAHRHPPSESVQSPALGIGTLLTIDAQPILDRCASMQKPTALDRTVELGAPTDSLPLSLVSMCALDLIKVSRGTVVSTQELLETRRSALVVLRC